MASTSTAGHGRGLWWLLAGALALALQWIVLAGGGVRLAPPWSAVAPGLGIVGAAFLLSWAAELAELEIPRTLALAFLALVAVLPEYAVDIYFAWTAGRDPTYAAYATANMTGANRLLIGLGWPLVLGALWIARRHTEVRLPRAQRVELWALLVATLYAFIIPWKRTISWIDTVVLLGIFAVYMRAVMRTRHEEPALEGLALRLARVPRPLRRLITLGLFGLSGCTIFIAAKPFAEGLLSTGRAFGVEEFVLVQWLAPLASEAPEFIVAILFALRGNAGSSLGTLISSKVNQWTLLVGMLPAAFGLSHLLAHGSLAPLPLDGRQAEEILLTAAQSLLAVAILANLAFSSGEAWLLLVLFVTQLCLPNPSVRWWYAGGYVVLAAVLLVVQRQRWRDLRDLLLAGWQPHR